MSYLNKIISVPRTKARDNKRVTLYVSESLYRDFCKRTRKVKSDSISAAVSNLMQETVKEKWKGEF